MLATGGVLLGGVGLFLLGMHLMTEGLRLAAGQALNDILATWTRDRLRGLLSGFLITGLVQSSSAVTVATIGFANAGLLSLEQAIWVIFGSNVGTTMTGWIVAIVGFKLDLEALALVAWLQDLLGLGAAPAVTLAVFHTVFNVLGVLLMLPIAPRLTPWLATRFRSEAEEASRPQHLDPTVLAVPAIAANAITMELQRLDALVVAHVRRCLDPAQGHIVSPARLTAIEDLSRAIGAFVARLGSHELPEKIAARLPHDLAALQNYRVAAEIAQEASDLRLPTALPTAIGASEAAFRDALSTALTVAQSAEGGSDLPELEAALKTVRALHGKLKAELHQAGATGQLDVQAMETLLRRNRVAQRAVKQIVRARRRLLS